MVVKELMLSLCPGEAHGARLWKGLGGMRIRLWNVGGWLSVPGRRHPKGQFLSGGTPGEGAEAWGKLEGPAVAETEVGLSGQWSFVQGCQGPRVPQCSSECS